ncbi:MAG: very short patch repair endonuclease [Anaerolineae bacterium]|nr:very short patch repair endonuclease [Anaerolineae bacterium]
MDTVSPQTRSEVMASVKSKSTKLEEFFAEKLKERGLEVFKRNVSELAGKPDFVYEDTRIAIFIDSCFWHGCKQHLRMPASNQDYWVAKIARNHKKDYQVTKQLTQEGWLVIRIWEHSLKNSRALKWWLTRIERLIALRQSVMTILVSPDSRVLFGETIEELEQDLANARRASVSRDAPL